MTDERWDRVKALFVAAAERPADERESFLASETREDASLRLEVESLLAAESAEVSFLDPLPVITESALGHVAPELWSPASSVLPTPGLVPGDQLGAYQIVALLGAGGMGEVYRACDTKLQREVALKVLPARFALAPDRRARFAREAQLLGTLNHPNIAALYGLEESGGAHALVLELVEGPTLADEIAKGPMPLREALPIARQVAEALEAAHDKGIIHRDIKPANVKVASDGTAKVLDFGLARVWDGAPHRDLVGSPKLTATDLDVRPILGTPTYMSPEQTRGQSLDRRTDLWSFGCVLYEMLAGRPPFAGETISDTLIAVRDGKVDETVLPLDTPPAIRRLLRRCLERDRRRRLDSAAAARLEIDDALAARTDGEPASGSPDSRPRPRLPVAIAVLGGVLAIAALLLVTLRERPAAPARPSRFGIVPPPAQPLNVASADRDVAISPDGRRLVYRAGGSVSAGSLLMVRSVDDLEARPIEKIVNAYGPFFSPDGQWLAFFDRAELKKIAITGGPITTLASFKGAPLGGSWGDDDTIVFATNDPTTGLWRVAATGGTPAALTNIEGGPSRHDHAFPSVLPGGRAVLFTITADDRVDGAQIAVLDLRTGVTRTLLPGASQAEYVLPAAAGSWYRRGDAVPTGLLVYAAGGALRAVRFDADKLVEIGNPVTVVNDVMIKPGGAANYALSRSGTLAYVPGSAGTQSTLRSLVWVDRNGHEEPTGLPLRAYGPPRLSPDATRVAVGIVDRGNTDIWILDLKGHTMRRLTFSPGMDGLPHWTRDSQRIVFMSGRAGVPNVYVQSADGTGPVSGLMTTPHSQWATAVMPDGNAVVGFEVGPGSGLGSVVVLPLAGAGDDVNPADASLSPRPGFKRLFEGAHPDISPDGRYIAYQAVNESGRDEVYVRPYPDVERGPWQISTHGGTRPAWARNGRELFYIDGSMALMRVSVRTSASSFSMDPPVAVFDTIYTQPNPARHYDVSPDGGRFLMVKEAPPDPNNTPASLIVVQQWFEELRQRVGGQ